MTTITVHLSITGRVQGVGYRESLRLVADALGVKGWVRNCAAGSVEATLQGEVQAVEGVIAWCHNGPPNASVQYVNSTLRVTEEHYTAFTRLPDTSTDS